MTKTLDKTELVRLAWLTELRRQGHRQCFGKYRRGTRVCALGLLLQVAGKSEEWADRYHNFQNPVGKLAGLSWKQSDLVMCMNDGKRPFWGLLPKHKHTFAEIADVVEGWFK